MTGNGKPAEDPAEEKADDRIRDELLHLLTLAGTLAGLCITAVTFFHTLRNDPLILTVADDMLAVAALFFLVCTYLIFIALKTRKRSLFTRLSQVIDVGFLIALTAMVLAGFIMVYTLW